MEFFIIWFSFFVIPFVYSEDKAYTPTQEKHLINVTQLANSNEKINITLPSEGGTLLASSELLSKDKQLITLLALDKELDKPKKTFIKPRKGVINTTADDNNKVLNAISSELQNSTITLNSEVDKTKPILSEVKNRTLPMSNVINTTEISRKPLVLSYEALANTDIHILNETKLPVLNPSSKTLPNLAKSQIPSPNEDAIVKVYPAKANSHPGMIMPIVITILVVPMFAIFGYMALKRGQEAWKNRHYKRMDFLLDGMYND